MQTVERVLTRAPRWIRQDLLSSDQHTRSQAEGALPAMIAHALVAGWRRWRRWFRDFRG